MSVAAFNDFIKAVTTKDAEPARKSKLNRIIGAYDPTLTGEAKGVAVMEQLVKAAKSEGFDVSMGDVTAYMQDLKKKYESDPMVASMMDANCNKTCHLGSVVGK